MQLTDKLNFDIVKDAPKQKILDLTGDIIDSSHEYYELFFGKSIFFFSTENPHNPKVYNITQI